MAAILNSAILDSTILAFPFKLTYTCQDWFPPFAQKKTFTHSFWLSLMLMAILNSTILDSAILVYPLKLTHTCQDWVQPFAQKKTSLTLPSQAFTQKDFILTQLNESAILNSAILNSAILDSVSALWNTDTLLSPLRFTQKHTHSTLTLTQTNLIWLKLIHSDSTRWWQPSWILPFWIWKSWIQES